MATLNLKELGELAEGKAVEFLNEQRLDDMEERYNNGRIYKHDTNVLIQAVRGLQRKRRLLEDILALNAAAPDLLAACKRVCDEIGSYDYHGGISLDALNQLVAAIAKAESQ